MKVKIVEEEYWLAMNIYHCKLKFELLICWSRRKEHFVKVNVEGSSKEQP